MTRRWRLSRAGAAGAAVGSALLFMALGGCVDSRSARPGELDAAFQLSATGWEEARPKPLRTDAATWPYRYELAFEPSPAWSTIKLYETFKALPNNNGVAVFPLSQQHADAMAALFSRTGDYVQRLAHVLEESGSGSDRRWATLTADLLLEVDALGASMSPDIERRRQVPLVWDNSAAWVLVPLLQSLSEFFTEELSPDLAAEQPDVVLVGGLLRSSFRLSGRNVPDGTTTAVLELLHDWDRADRRQALADLLETARDATPQRYPELQRSAQKAARAADGLASTLAFLAAMTAQWNRFNSVALELRERDGRTIAGLEYDIVPGAAVELDGLHFAAPRAELVGHGWVVVSYERDEAREIVVRFSSAGDGGLILRFQGLLHALVDLLAFKLDDAYLRELRFVSRRDFERGKVRTYALLMDALNGAERRRVVRIETTKTAILSERPELPPRLDGRRRTTDFEYHNGRKVYQYRSSRTEPPELWGYRANQPAADGRP